MTEKKKAGARKPGRPSAYTEAIAKKILARLAAGESLRSICSGDGMPNRETVHRWVVDDVCGFYGHYARAREIGLENMADEIIDIADAEPGSLVTGATDSGDVANKRLRVDSRRWYLSKMAPKKYGDKQTVEHGGGTKNEVRIVSEFGDDDGADS